MILLAIIAAILGGLSCGGLIAMSIYIVKQDIEKDDRFLEQVDYGNKRMRRPQTGMRPGQKRIIKDIEKYKKEKGITTGTFEEVIWQ